MNAADPNATRPRPRIEPGRVGFDLFLLVIVGTLVLTAFSLRPAAALVPLIIGVPAALALIVRLVLDVFRVGRDYRPEPAEELDLDADDVAHASVAELTRAARAEIEEENKLDPTESGKQRLFILWGVGYVVLSALMTLFVPPVLGLRTWFLPVAFAAMVVILRLIRIAWWKTLAISAGLIAVMYLLLVVFLQVRL